MSDSPSSKSAAKPLLLWFLLFFLSRPKPALFLAWIDVPAAFFVASVVCGVTFSLFGSGLTLPRRFFYCAQALVGLLCRQEHDARGFQRAGEQLVGAGWNGFQFGDRRWFGWLVSDQIPYPAGQYGGLGVFARGANAMIAMAESYGADARMVAMMQYLRVLVVVLSASLVAHWLSVPQTPPQHSAQAVAGLLLQGNSAQTALTLGSPPRPASWRFVCAFPPGRCWRR